MVLVFLLLAAPGVAAAQDAGWRFAVQLYVLVPTMQGTAGLRRFDADVDISPGDVFDNLNTAIRAMSERAHVQVLRQRTGNPSL